jgi:hypothetical protein
MFEHQDRHVAIDMNGAVLMLAEEVGRKPRSFGEYAKANGHVIDRQEGDDKACYEPSAPNPACEFFNVACGNRPVIEMTCMPPLRRSMVQLCDLMSEWMTALSRLVSDCSG